MFVTRPDSAEKPLRVFYLYRRRHRDQLTFDNFFLPFGGILSRDYSRIRVADFIPWDELEHDNAARFCKGFAAAAKPFRMALGSMIIKSRLGLTVEELVAQIKVNPYPQFIIVLGGYQYAAPFIRRSRCTSGNDSRYR